MEALHLIYAIVGALAVALALASRRMRQLPLSEPLLALISGAVVGPQALGLVAVPEHLRDLALLETSRLIVAVSVMGAALRFPARRLRAIGKPVLLLLVVVMPAAALISGAAALFLGLPVAIAALVGACLSPTDPVLAGSIVSGAPAERDLPARMRHILTAESGLNDGLALPLVAVAVTLVVPATTAGGQIGRIAYEVVGALLVGAIVGTIAGWAARVATRHHDLEPGPDLVLTILVAVATLGIGAAIHTDGILAVFIAGTAYNLLVTRKEREPQQAIDDAVNRYLALPLFFLFGLVLPWAEWARLGPAALVFVVVVLLARRLPLVVAMSRPLGLGVKEATFAGWFGPMGASSIFYLADSVDMGVTDPRFFAAGSLMIAVSVLVFGLTSSPGRTLYARGSAPAKTRDG